MRIISQDGTIDIPYEISAITIGRKGDLSEFHINVRSKLLDERPCIVASYSTEEKAEKAMEMLRAAYSPMLVIKEQQDGIKPNIKPNEWSIAPTLPTPTIENNFYFQFPADEDVEV